MLDRVLIDGAAITRQVDEQYQPDPPASALPIATNSLFQRTTDPKSRVSASAIAGGGLPPSPPMLAK